MLFIFKKKKIVLDCFTSNPAINEYYPITKSTKHMPEWWKQLPNTYDTGNPPGFEKLGNLGLTMRKCSGFVDLYKNSISIPICCDLRIQTKLDGTFAFQYADTNGIERRFGIDSHSPEQLGDYFNNFIHMKILSPWIIKEKTGINFQLTSSFWNNIQHLGNLHITPGILAFNCQHVTNINMLVPKCDNLIEFTAGIPIVNLMPMSEKDIIIKTHLIDDSEMFQIAKSTTFHPKFSGSYEEKVKIKKQKNKCPLGFGE